MTHCISQASVIRRDRLPLALPQYPALRLETKGGKSNATIRRPHSSPNGSIVRRDSLRPRARAARHIYLTGHAHRPPAVAGRDVLLRHQPRHSVGSVRPMSLGGPAQRSGGLSQPSPMVVRELPVVQGERDRVRHHVLPSGNNTGGRRIVAGVSSPAGIRRGRFGGPATRSRTPGQPSVLIGDDLAGSQGTVDAKRYRPGCLPTRRRSGRRSRRGPCSLR
jgi:hypothetical protein